MHKLKHFRHRYYPFPVLSGDGRVGKRPAIAPQGENRRGRAKARRSREWRHQRMPLSTDSVQELAGRDDRFAPRVPCENRRGDGADCRLRTPGNACGQTASPATGVPRRRNGGRVLTPPCTRPFPRGEFFYSARQLPSRLRRYRVFRSQFSQFSGVSFSSFVRTCCMSREANCRSDRSLR